MKWFFSIDPSSRLKLDILIALSCRLDYIFGPFEIYKWKNVEWVHPVGGFIEESKVPFEYKRGFWKDNCLT
jgi:hypothetical protein